MRMKSEHLHNDWPASQEEFRSLTSQEQILNVAKNWEVPVSCSVEDMHEKLKQRIQSEEKLTIAPKKTYYWQIAAIFLAIVGLFFLFQSSEKVIKTQTAETTTVILPDGSSVFLNADSKLIYNKNKFIEKRTLFMDGEAFFEVQKGSRFTINTSSKGTVEILGTSLNVLSRKKQFTVECLTGKVKVNYDNRSTIILPEEKTELKDQDLIKLKVKNPSQMASWRNGIFYFEDQPLIYIFDELERQYHVTVDVTGIGERYYTGAFDNKNLIEALETVCIPMNLSYDIQKGNKVIIMEKTSP